jgi:glycosyltransferase involved in cell wall biosynthesis
MPQDEALAFLKAADVFLFASQTETQGLVLAEALAAGLPVVALDGPGVSDTVRDGMDGIVVPRGPAETRAERLGRALGQLLSDRPRRDRMAAAAAADAARLSSGARVRQVAELYEEVLAAGR